MQLPAYALTCQLWLPLPQAETVEASRRRSRVIGDSCSVVVVSCDPRIISGNQTSSSGAPAGGGEDAGGSFQPLAVESMARRTSTRPIVLGEEGVPRNPRTASATRAAATVASRVPMSFGYARCPPPEHISSPGGGGLGDGGGGEGDGGGGEGGGAEGGSGLGGGGEGSISYFPATPMLGRPSLSVSSRSRVGWGRLGLRLSLGLRLCVSNLDPNPNPAPTLTLPQPYSY